VQENRRGAGAWEPVRQGSAWSGEGRLAIHLGQELGGYEGTLTEEYTWICEESLPLNLTRKESLGCAGEKKNL